MLLNFR